MAEQLRTTVPYHYRVRLVGRFPVPKKNSDGTFTKTYLEHGMHLAGQLHPQPYDYATALELAQQFLQPLVDLGWVIRSLVVNAYDTKDA